MKLQDLQYLPTTTLAASQTVYRVQRAKARAGAAKVGPLRMSPIGEMSSRFAVAAVAAGYFAEHPETALYESVVRREATSVSLTMLAGRVILCMQTTSPVRLLDLRPHASTWPVLQSLRFSATQELAADALAAGYEGVAYRSAQQYGQDCFVVFGVSLHAFKLVWRKPLMLPNGAMHRSLVAAIHGGQIVVTP